MLGGKETGSLMRSTGHQPLRQALDRTSGSLERAMKACQATIFAVLSVGQMAFAQRPLSDPSLFSTVVNGRAAKVVSLERVFGRGHDSLLRRSLVYDTA